MDKNTIKQLLKCVQSDVLDFTATKGLAEFVTSYGGVGSVRKKKVTILPQHKEKIRSLLESIGIDPKTHPCAWDDAKGRADSLSIGGNDEKTFFSGRVKRRRVLIKALSPSFAINLNEQSINLPARCHLELDCDTAVTLDHDILICVENWECFNDIHIAAEHEYLSFPGRSPLVVWRGDQDAGIDSSLNFLESHDQPVFMFGDYDPRGLIIAKGMPRLAGFIAPPNEILSKMIRDLGISYRYQCQLPTSYNALESCEIDYLKNLWNIIRREGKALPQEHFVRTVK